MALLRRDRAERLAETGNPTPWPPNIEELSPIETLVVRSFRRWVKGLHENTAAYWSTVWDEFAGRFGGDAGRAALTDFAMLVRAIQTGARRRISYHQPCCPCVGADEAAVVGFVSACQRRDWPLARARAQWLVRDETVGEMIAAGAALAGKLAHHGEVFPDRLPPAPVATDDGEPPKPRRVH